MKKRSGPTPSISLGVRVATVTSLGVLAAVLLAALALEVRGRTEARGVAVESLRRARTVAADRLSRQGESLSRLATTVSRDPKFFALLTMEPSERTGSFRQALEGVVREFQRDAASEVFDVTDQGGATLAASARAAAPEADRAASPLIRIALGGRGTTGYRVEGGRLYRVAVVPVVAEGGSVVGTLTLGAPLAEEFANAIRSATGADVILVANTQARAGGAPSETGRPLATTLTDAATRSLLGTIGAPPASPRWTPRDAKEVSTAKLPALAVDVPLAGAIEGGTPRLIVATPLAVGSGLAAAREVLLGAGALSALLALLLGGAVGGRLGHRLRRLGVAVREARHGNYDTPLPEGDQDETGDLIREFDAMRAAQRQELDRLVELDRMKTDFITVTAQDILAPAAEIETVATALSMGRAGELAPEAMKRILHIRRNAGNLTRLATDLGGSSVVSRLATAVETEAAPRDDAKAEETPEASVEVVTSEEAFHPTPSPRSEAPPAAGAEVDIAALVEGLAVEFLPSAAERGLEVDLSVDPDLVHPRMEREEFEQAIRVYMNGAVCEAPVGSKLLFRARRLDDSIEVRLEGGHEPFEARLELPSTSDTAA